MRLLKIKLTNQGDYVAITEDDVALGGAHDLYVDANTGVVHALSRDHVGNLDPLWRDDTPESA